MQTHGRPVTRDELRQHPRQRRHPRRRGARPRRDGAAAASPTGSPPTPPFPSTMVDRIAPGDDAGRPRHGGAALRLPRSRGGGRRAVPAMGDRRPLRRPRCRAGISPARRFVDDVDAVRAAEDARPQRARSDARLPRRAGRPRAHLRRHRRPAARRLRPPHAGRGERADAARRCRASRRSPMSSRASTGCATPPIRHRNHQIATDGSQKIVAAPAQPEPPSGCGAARASRCLAVRGRRLDGLSRPRLDRFGRRWTVDDPLGGRVAAIADRIGRRRAGAGRRRSSRSTRSSIPRSPRAADFRARRRRAASTACCRPMPMAYVRRFGCESTGKRRDQSGRRITGGA